MSEDKGGEDEGGDNDDDDGSNDDMILATQPPEPPPLLSRVYDVESLDNDAPDPPCDRGDANKYTSDPNAEQPSHTQTQVDRFTFNSRSHSLPL